ncbi:MAG: glutamate--tRNA ligase [Leptospirales bacterium]
MDTKPGLVRTRFAPSPTGYLHVGGARTALFNYLYARAKGGQFILRIEDTDQARSTEESYHQMLESMRWLGLTWDEGPEMGGPYGSYRQSERLDIYREKSEELVQKKKAYYCFCSSEELENKKKKREAIGLPPVYDGKCANLNEKELQEKMDEKIPYVVRFRTPNKEILVKDMVQGDVRFDASLIGDFIIVKSDKFPSYNFAVVVDDYLMKINHIIRGVGHLSNTPRQIVIYQALEWEEPNWAHVSEIVGSDHKKLSKRHGATAITAFRDLGYPSHAFVNYMALLGWSAPDGNEFMPVSKIIEQFDVARCSKSPAMFDVFDLKKAVDVELNDVPVNELEQYLFPKSKLNWLGNLHIRDMSPEDYIEAILPRIKQVKKIPESEINSDNENLKSILLSLRVYLDYFNQIRHHIGDFYDDQLDIQAAAEEWLSKEETPKLIEIFHKNLENLEELSEDSVKNCINESGKAVNVKGKQLFMTLRSAITGKTAGLELPVYILLLGKKRVINRLDTINRN